MILAYIGRAVVDCHRVVHGGIHCGLTQGGTLILIFLTVVLVITPLLVVFVLEPERR